MKIVLAYKASVDVVAEPFLSLLPVGLGIMAAVLRADGRDVKIANLSTDSWRQVERFLTAEAPAILAISVFTHNRLAAKRLASIMHKIRPDCWVVCGGPHASSSPQEVLAWPGVDAVVVGEGEETLREVVRCRHEASHGKIPALAGMLVRDGQRVGVPPRRLSPTQLDGLPFAHQGLKGVHGVDQRRQAEFVITSRGCPAACTFCSSPGFWGRQLYFRSADSVVREIKAIQEDLGLLYFSIRDDTFTADRRRVIEICRRIIEERLYILWNCQSRVSAVDEELLGWLKRAGCECIQFGIESGAPRVLQSLGKQISLQQIRLAVAAARRVGLQVSVYLIAGTPGETMTDIAATEALLQEILPHDGQVAPLVYYPGTALFADAVANGQVSADLFTSSPAEALYVRDDQFVPAAVQRLLSCLQRLGKRAAYRKVDYLAHKNLLGYCHATNLQTGEYYARLGQWAAARREYEEIVRRQPKNPWGWLALGELALAQEQWSEALRLLAEVHHLVPRHLPVLLTLAETALLIGDRMQGKQWLARAESLAPGDGGVKELRRQSTGR